MVVFKAINPKVEVNGETVLSVSDGMGVFKSHALLILKDNGIEDPKPGHWYLQQSWLNAFKRISEKIGQSTLEMIGKAIPNHAQWPPTVNSVETALGSIDIAYHMNHRLDGKQLFDPTTGAISEGIGHYKFEHVGEKSAKVICDNPYPCAFDKGIIEAAAQKFANKDALIIVEHDPASCRSKGDNSCTYNVMW